MTVAENVETLPQPRGGDYEIARFNALRHGVLSQYTVLPWEDRVEYGSLVEALVAEHNPQGPTEEHLVEELAGVIWRKRRLRLRGDTRKWWEEQLTRERDDYDEDQEPYRADAESLKRILENEILPWYEMRRRELDHRPLIRAQAFGEAVDPACLERLARYEVHLDRKLERTVAMLLKLQEICDASKPG
jgi:hypothetical protein